MPISAVSQVVQASPALHGIIDANQATSSAVFTPDDFYKIVLPIITLLALLIGSYIQLRIAKRQVAMQEEIAKRQVAMQEEIAKRQVAMQEEISKRQVAMQEENAKRQAETQQQIAKRQIADSISSRRQVWIDELRRDASEYLTLVARLEELKRPAQNLSEEDQKKNFDEMAVANARSHELGIRIKLRLNPIEEEHNKLVDLLVALADVCKEPPPNETANQKLSAQQAFGKARSDIVSHLQTILKHEWERVKRGDV
jgi:hypothetical protein